MRVLHFSDLHLEHGLAEAPIRAFGSKRALGFLNLVTRRRAHFAGAMERVRALEVFADARSVDVALCTGDYTALGTSAELASAFDSTERLLRRPLGFATVPGNHDLYVHDDDGTFASRFADGLRSDDASLDFARGDPYLRFFGQELAVIGLASARPNPLHSSSGAVPAKQLDRLPALLAREDVRARFTLVALHYAPRLWDGRPDSPLHGLDNHEALIEAVRELRFGAVVFGHVHHGYVVKLAGLAAPLVGAGSATYVGRESAFEWEISATRAVARKLVFREGAFVPETEAAGVVVERA